MPARVYGYVRVCMCVYDEFVCLWRDADNLIGRVPHLETNLLAEIGSWIDAPKVPGVLVGRKGVG